MKTSNRPEFYWHSIRKPARESEALQAELLETVAVPVDLLLAAGRRGDEDPFGDDDEENTHQNGGAGVRRLSGDDLDRDILFLKAGAFTLVSTVQLDTRNAAMSGRCYVYRDTQGYEIRTRLGPDESPIKCLIHGHKTKWKWTRLDQATLLYLTALPFTLYWMSKNAQVECKDCGALIRPRLGKHIFQAGLQVRRKQ